VLREVTERPEGVSAGVARLVGTGRDRIVQAADELLSDESARRAMATARNPYGDGQAARRIADIVIHHLTGRPRETSDWEAGCGASSRASTSRPSPAGLNATRTDSAHR